MLKVIDELESIKESLLGEECKKLSEIISDLNLMLLVPTLDERNRKFRELVKLRNKIK